MSDAWMRCDRDAIKAPSAEAPCYDWVWATAEIQAVRNALLAKGITRAICTYGGSDGSAVATFRYALAEARRHELATLRSLLRHTLHHTESSRTEGDDVVAELHNFAEEMALARLGDAYGRDPSEIHNGFLIDLETGEILNLTGEA